MAQAGDVLLSQTDDGGEITIANGLLGMSGGLETAAYVSLFGGNENDDGLSENGLNWWANFGETDPARQYRSETQFLLKSLPATTGNLGRIEDAAERDLAWFVEKKVASSVKVSASIPGLNRVTITVDIEAQGEESNFEFAENWKVSA